MKVVINTCFGGFGLSEKAYEFLGIPWDGYGFAFSEDEKRTDPRLVECVETLGREADGTFAELKVVDVPDGISWEIEEYDGVESVHETHMVWS